MAEPSLFSRKDAWFRALVSAEARPGDMLVAHALASYMLKSEDCWPGQGTLSLSTGLSRQTISRVVGRLERAGALTVDRSVRKDDGRQGAATYALALPFDPGRAAAVLREGRAGRSSPASPRADAGTQRSPVQAPASPADGSSVARERFQRRRVATEREGRESGEEKEGKQSPFSGQTKTKRPDESTPGLGGWSGLDVRRLAPPCEHGPLTLAWNKREGSWYAFCRAGCGKTFDPRHEQRAPYETDEQANEREAARRAHPPRSRPRYPYAPPSEDVAALTKEMSVSA